MTQLLFEVTRDGHEARRFYLRHDLSIGRHIQNDITLEDSKASGSHAKVIQKNGKFYVVDLGSSNRTHIFNGPSLTQDEEWLIQEGVKFKIGDSEFIAYEVAIENEATIKDPAPTPPSEQPVANQVEDPKPKPEEPAKPEKAEQTKQSRRRPSPLELPRDGAHHIGTFLAPHEDLAPGDNNRPTTAAQFPRIDTATLRNSLGEASGLSPKRVPKKPDSPDEAKTPPAFAAESTILSGSVIPSSSEGKTTSSKIPTFPNDDANESENPTTNVEIGSISPLRASLPHLGDGPDPDEATLLSPPPKRSSGLPASQSPSKASVPPARDAMNLAPPEILDDEGATVLSPVVSANASAETKKSKQGEAHPDHAVANEATVLSPSTNAPDFLNANQRTQAQSSIVEFERRLTMMRPRLVLSHDLFKFVARITNDEFTIGRASQSKVVHVNCAVDHSSVSANHAAILHRDGWFFIEDRDSRNGTTVGGRELQPMTRAKLKMDMAIKLGVVDILFVVDRDQKLVEPDRSHYRPALEYLVRQKIIRQGTAKDLWGAFTRENQHPGEKLILEGRIGVSQWTDALKAASADSTLASPSGAGWRNLALATSAIAVLLLVLVVLIETNQLP